MGAFSRRHFQIQIYGRNCKKFAEDFTEIPEALSLQYWSNGSNNLVPLRRQAIVLTNDE